MAMGACSAPCWGLDRAIISNGCAAGDAGRCGWLPLDGYEGKPWPAVALLLRGDCAIAGGDRRHADAHHGIIIGTEIAVSRIALQDWRTDDVIPTRGRAAHVGHNEK